MKCIRWPSNSFFNFMTFQSAVHCTNCRCHSVFQRSTCKNRKTMITYLSTTKAVQQHTAISVGIMYTQICFFLNVIHPSDNRKCSPFECNAHDLSREAWKLQCSLFRLFALRDNQEHLSFTSSNAILVSCWHFKSLVDVVSADPCQWPHQLYPIWTMLAAISTSIFLCEDITFEETPSQSCFCMHVWRIWTLQFSLHYVHVLMLDSNCFKIQQDWPLIKNTLWV